MLSEKSDSDNFDEKYMETRFNSDDDSPLRKTLEIPDVVIKNWYVFDITVQIFLDECLYKSTK